MLTSMTTTTIMFRPIPMGKDFTTTTMITIMGMSIRTIMITTTDMTTAIITGTTTVMSIRMTMTTITDMTTATTMDTSTVPAVVAMNRMTTANTNWYTITRPIHTQCIWPAIRTTASVIPAIPMKNIAISAGKAWHTASAVCRTPTM